MRGPLAGRGPLCSGYPTHAWLRACCRWRCSCSHDLRISVRVLCTCALCVCGCVCVCVLQNHKLLWWNFNYRHSAVPRGCVCVCECVCASLCACVCVCTSLCMCGTPAAVAFLASKSSLVPRLASPRPGSPGGIHNICCTHTNIACGSHRATQAHAQLHFRISLP